MPAEITISDIVAACQEVVTDYKQITDMEELLATIDTDTIEGDAQFAACTNSSDMVDARKSVFRSISLLKQLLSKF